MGYDLPAAIGACVGSGGKEIICLAGDGSIQQNIQELATIAHLKYPIKIFVLNNNGYHSIRQTQTNFGEPHIGCGPESGVGFPSMEKIAFAYEIPYSQISSHKDIESVVTSILKEKGPFICEVMLTLDQGFEPKASSRKLESGSIVSSTLDDLKPFLPTEELEENRLN